MIDCIVTLFAVVLAGAGLRTHSAAGKFRGTPSFAGVPSGLFRSY